MSQHSIDLERVYSPKTESVASYLLKYFGQNPYYAQTRTLGTEVTYLPIRVAITEEVMQSHLRGESTIGAYQLDHQDSTVLWLGWDIDSVDRETARAYVHRIIPFLKELPYACEFSGNKGYHLLIFLSDKMSASQAKRITEHVRDLAGLPKSGAHHCECFPKQEKLTASNPMGSLLKVPLGVHPKSHQRSRFVDPENGWEIGQDLPALEILGRSVTPNAAMSLLKDTTSAKDDVVNILAPFWSSASGEHHNLSMYLAGFLSNLGWGLEEAKEVVRQLSITTGDSEITNRLNAVEDTFRNHLLGKKVKGLSGLSDLLPGSILQSLSVAARDTVAPLVTKAIDAIRLSRMPPFKKIEAVVGRVWDDLNEYGSVVRTVAGAVYWYCEEDHLLTQFETTDWSVNLLKRYGIGCDSFSYVCEKQITRYALSKARIVDVHNRTFWDFEQSILWISLGGPNVYKLTGSGIQTANNGECGLMFKTSPDGKYILPDWNNAGNVWASLVDDLSFNTTDEAKSNPQEQRELMKSWILSFFFQEVMPTKPILVMLGAPGSGKTTAMRRVLRVLESPDAEVNELVQDKQDSMRVSIERHRLLVLDNLERTESRWIVDVLNRISTGAEIEIRQLYKTNDSHAIRPKCSVALTAVSMPFSDETLFSRLLPLSMSRLVAPVPEHLIQRRLAAALPGIWADLLNKLDVVVMALRSDTSTTAPINSRLADFTIFCKHIANCSAVDGKTLMMGLRRLVDSQRLEMASSSPFMAALEDWLSAAAHDAAKYHTMKELFRTLEPMCRTRKMEWGWKNPSAMKSHIVMLAPYLTRNYSAVFDPCNDRGEPAGDDFRVKFGQ